MKRFALCFIAVLIFLSMGVACLASSMSYVGNKSTKVYHMSECTYAGRTSTQNRIYFRSRSEAEANGYRRCHYCGDGVVEEGNGGGSSSGGSSSGSSDTEKASQPTKDADKDTNRKTVGEIVGTVFCAVFYGAGIIILMYDFCAPTNDSKKSRKYYRRR